MTSLVRSFTLFALVSTGCFIGDGDDAECTGGKCDGAGGGVCIDARYGDGMCQTQLECAVPDIDCFQTFEDDEAAAAWFTEFEERVALEEGRAPRTMLTAADPRFVRTRELLDRGWEAFREHRPVGDLRGFRPALVLLEDEAPNAFVAPDLTSGNAGFAVMVQTGLLTTGASEDGVIGVMMHEFQHAVGLHVVGDVKDRLRKFYIAPEGSEPIGKFQVDDPMARSFGVAWRAAADEVGSFADPALGGLPIGGQIDQVFKAAIAQGLEVNPSGCTPARAHYEALRGDVIDSVDRISGAITLDPAVLSERVQQALAVLRDDCLGELSVDFIAVVAGMAGTTPDVIEAQMTPEDLALVKGKHVIDGIAALASDRRARMRAGEAAFATATGRPWSALRYFSYEEDADDVSVPVLRAASFAPDGLGPFLVSVLPADARAACESLLEGREVPPYGLDLKDEHHGVCWRAHHIRQVAESTAKRAARHALQPVVPQKRLPIPRPLSDRLAY